MRRQAHNSDLQCSSLECVSSFKRTDLPAYCPMTRCIKYMHDTFENNIDIHIGKTMHYMYWGWHFQAGKALYCWNEIVCCETSSLWVYYNYYQLWYKGTMDNIQCIIAREDSTLGELFVLSKKGYHVNEHERLSNITLGQKWK